MKKDFHTKNYDIRAEAEQNKTAHKKWPHRFMTVWIALVLAFTVFAVPAYADGDPLTVVNNLSNYIFNCLRAVGVIVLGWGIVQIGMSTQSHDASQRTQGFLCFFGGLLVAFAKEILAAIGVL